MKKQKRNPKPKHETLESLWNRVNQVSQYNREIYASNRDLVGFINDVIARSFKSGVTMDTLKQWFYHPNIPVDVEAAIRAAIRTEL